MVEVVVELLLAHGVELIGAAEADGREGLQGLESEEGCATLSGGRSHARGCE